MENQPDLGQNLYRIGEIEPIGCWFGYIYFKNNTEFEISQSVTLTLKGLEIFKRPSAEI